MRVGNRKSAIRNLKSDESGQSITVLVIIASLAMLLIIGLLHDGGAVAVAQVQAQAAADLAAQEAVKNLDLGAFYSGQRIELTAGALAIAQQRLAEYYQGPLTLTTLEVVYPNRHNVAVRLEARLLVPTPYLRMIGIPRIERRIQTVAVPAFGNEREGQ